MSEHAKLSASSAHRWLACPPSVRLCDGIADTSSIYAAEGTLAHAVAELKLKKYFYPPSVKDYKAELETLKQKHIWQGESLWQKEMDGYSDFYVEYITNLCLSKERAPHVAVEKRVDFSIWAPEGFGTADCVVLSDDVAHVIDLKYGKGVVVDAENNPQLMLYALGVYETYKILYGIKTFVLTIVQPGSTVNFAKLKRLVVPELKRISSLLDLLKPCLTHSHLKNLGNSSNRANL